jgi:hypothetical protein
VSLQGGVELEVEVEVGRLGGTWEGELMMLRQQYGNRLVAEYYAITKPVVTVTNSTE